MFIHLKLVLIDNHISMKFNIKRIFIKTQKILYNTPNTTDKPIIQYNPITKARTVKTNVDDPLKQHHKTPKKYQISFINLHLNE